MYSLYNYKPTPQKNTSISTLYNSNHTCHQSRSNLSLTSSSPRSSTTNPREVINNLHPKEIKRAALKLPSQKVVSHHHFKLITTNYTLSRTTKREPVNSANMITPTTTTSSSTPASSTRIVEMVSSTTPNNTKIIKIDPRPTTKVAEAANTNLIIIITLLKDRTATKVTTRTTSSATKN